MTDVDPTISNPHHSHSFHITSPVGNKDDYENESDDATNNNSGGKCNHSISQSKLIFIIRRIVLFYITII